MALTEGLIKKLRQQYQPHSTVDFSFRGKDISVITDKDGNAVQIFIGKRKDNGHVRGERYARKMVRDKHGKLIKDHWDRKGTSH